MRSMYTNNTTLGASADMHALITRTWVTVVRDIYTDHNNMGDIAEWHTLTTIIWVTVARGPLPPISVLSNTPLVQKVNRVLGDTLYTQTTQQC